MRGGIQGMNKNTAEGPRELRGVKSIEDTGCMKGMLNKKQLINGLFYNRFFC